FALHPGHAGLRPGRQRRRAGPDVDPVALLEVRDGPLPTGVPPHARVRRGAGGSGRRPRGDAAVLRHPPGRSAALRALFRDGPRGQDARGKSRRAGAPEARPGERLAARGRPPEIAPEPLWPWAARLLYHAAKALPAMWVLIVCYRELAPEGAGAPE